LERHLTESAFTSFIDHLVHEMRNPLFGVSSTLDAWESNLGPAPDQLAYLHAARGGVDRLRSILQNLSVWTRPIPMALAPHGLSTTLPAVIDRRVDLAKERGVALCGRIEPDLPVIEVDAARISEALGTVLEVAIQRSMPGTSVEVMASSDRAEARLDAIVISVRAYGKNTGTEELESFFEPFRASWGPDGGLGLAIARRIIEAHGGTLTARFVADGTLFTVRLEAGPFRRSAEAGTDHGSKSTRR
jgi:signal transduction histidine kinase